eukprot:GHVL01015699.1.p1 GENE.GHVL01015699.1~~GHVL01015699.1.p1  ORF type:complete len:256 (-),score=80.24 GHVL01015699.1:943-1710(-)
MNIFFYIYIFIYKIICIKEAHYDTPLKHYELSVTSEITDPIIKTEKIILKCPHEFEPVDDYCLKRSETVAQKYCPKGFSINGDDMCIKNNIYAPRVECPWGYELIHYPTPIEIDEGVDLKGICFRMVEIEATRQCADGFILADVEEDVGYNELGPPGLKPYCELYQGSCAPHIPMIDTPKDVLKIYNLNNNINNNIYENNNNIYDGDSYYNGETEIRYNIQQRRLLDTELTTRCVDMVVSQVETVCNGYINKDTG